MEFDARGLACPLPLIETKKLLSSMKIGAKLIITVSDPIAIDNLSRFLLDLAVSYKTKLNDSSDTIITVTKNKEIIKRDTQIEMPDLVTKQISNGSVIVINSEFMGHGSDELGRVLMQMFINSLPEIDDIPKQIIFYNSGVTFVGYDSPVLESLKKMIDKGVAIQSCGACLDYFKLKDKLAIGEVSNMYSIIEFLYEAKKVITP
jgi:selenium metabolism protein YedF